MLSFIKSLLTPQPKPLQEPIFPLAKIRETGRCVSEHADALAELFALELREYSGRQRRRAVLFALSVVPAVAAWFCLCALAVWLLHVSCGWGWALAAVTLVNVLLSAAAVGAALMCRVGAFAPQTRQELNNDWQCLKLLINAGKKS